MAIRIFFCLGRNKRSVFTNLRTRESNNVGHDFAFRILLLKNSLILYDFEGSNHFLGLIKANIGKEMVVIARKSF